MTETNNKENIALVINVIKFSGFIFILMGAFCLMYPDKLYDFLGFDLMLSRIFGGTLIFAGLMDLFVIPKIFLKTNRETK